jgi:cyclase
MIRRLSTVLALALAGGFLAAAASGQTPIASEKIADGVWAAPTPGGANVGWFTVGDTVVAVDAGANEDVGRALLDEIQKTAGRKPRYLVLTHAHKDHAGGAPAFAAAGVQVMAAEKAATGVLFVLGGAAAEPAKSPASPLVLTVAERSLLVGKDPRRAEIYYLGPGHTQGDLVIVVPDAGVLFSGDLVVNGVLPFLRSSDVDPIGWERILPRLAALRIDKLVPGHGAIGPKNGIADTDAYIRRVNEIAAKIAVAGLPPAMWEGQIRAPENLIENVPVTPDHIANVRAVAEREIARRAAAGAKTAPTPSPTVPPK